MLNIEYLEHINGLLKLREVLKFDQARIKFILKG
jgi:hypothetical protein